MGEIVKELEKYLDEEYPGLDIAKPTIYCGVEYASGYEMLEKTDSKYQMYMDKIKKIKK